MSGPSSLDLRERIARVVFEANNYPGTRSWQPDWNTEHSRPGQELNVGRSRELIEELLGAVRAARFPDPVPESGGPMTGHKLRHIAGWLDLYDDLARNVSDGEVTPGNDVRADLRRWADELDAAPPPVPPWPGAVLSGLVDEDGQPTWLAQAGQVRGEQVRARTDRGWDDCDGYIATAWVEVRAPRPAPTTERVQAWEAVRDGRQVVGASSPFEAHYIWRSGPNRASIGERTMDKAVLVAPDGTVEVLRRDGES